jgi:hypothetical protein
VQRWGGPIEEIHPGDAVWLAPGEKHWHGAAPLTAMTHVAIGEVLDGKSADWMEKVSDEPTKGGHPRKGAASIQYTKRDAEETHERGPRLYNTQNVMPKAGESATFGETKFCVVRFVGRNPLSMSQTSSPDVYLPNV